jgi:hypothetical protein
LYHSNLTDRGASHLSEALKLNNTLTELDLGGNKLTDTGKETLEAAASPNLRIIF